ncbi:MAG: helix-turn-helix domain-containing protein [Solirubrobacterales bacterium]
MILRRRLGLGQEDLGFAADLHKTETSRLERGLEAPRISTRSKLAASLEVDPDELLAGIILEAGVLFDPATSWSSQWRDFA